MERVREGFSFGKMAPSFRRHIEASIPGYKTGLIPDCVRQSERFVQPGTNVYDVGCTTGHLLARVRRVNNKARPGVRYVGIDIEPDFCSYWDKHGRRNLSFELHDARAYKFERASAIFRGPRIIAVAWNLGDLWGEQHGIETRTKPNHSWVNSGRLTIGGNYSRSPLACSRSSSFHQRIRPRC
jgi:SAM-dependent methyltransferase